ncbi:MAG: hypothetical protein M0020_09480 [Actinomycetota bacterium]|nr:hypothetical protein [Actinomycetota bacterium]
MAVQDDCRHYIMQTVSGGDRTERCRLGANGNLPFSCPDGCVFYEARKVSQAGWQRPRDPGAAGGDGDPRGPGGSRGPGGNSGGGAGPQ